MDESANALSAEIVPNHTESDSANSAASTTTIATAAAATTIAKSATRASAGKRVLSGLPARKPDTRATTKAITTAGKPRTLKERAAASLTPRPKKRQHVEAILAAVQSADEYSSLPPIQPSKPQGRLQRLWSKVVSAGKKVISSPARWFKRK